MTLGIPNVIIIFTPADWTVILNDHTKPDGSSFIFVCKYPYIDRGNAYSFKSVILSDSAGYGC